jgi:hypothetical protein
VMSSAKMSLRMGVVRTDQPINLNCIEKERREC